MRRREFVTLAGGAMAAWPFLARGQKAWAQEPGRTYRLGMVIPSGRDAPPIVAFFDELRRNGFIEGQNLNVTARFNVRDGEIADATAEVVTAQPDAIVASGEPTRVLQRATATIPLLAMAEDMLAEGLVQSLARPGGNTTGMSMLSPGLDGKRQDLLMDAVPNARRIGALADAKTIAIRHIEELMHAARLRGAELTIIKVGGVGEIVSSIESAKASGLQALNVLATPLFGSYPNRRSVMDTVAALRMPAIYQWPDMAEEGGLMAYGPSFIDIYRQRARLLIRVLKGARPADIPVEQPTRFELVINLKTAKAIGHEVPAGLVLRADKLVD